MSERILKPEEYSEGYVRLQEQIDAITLSMEPAIVIDNAHLTTRVEELEAQVADITKAIELIKK